MVRCQWPFLPDQVDTLNHIEAGLLFVLRCEQLLVAQPHLDQFVAEATLVEIIHLFFGLDWLNRRANDNSGGEEFELRHRASQNNTAHRDGDGQNLPTLAILLLQIVCRLNEVFKGATGVGARRHQLQIVAFRIFAKATIAKDYDTVALGDKLVYTCSDFCREGMTAAAWHEEDDWTLRVYTEVSLEAEANLAAIAQEIIFLKVVLIRHVIKDELVSHSCLDGSAVTG